MEKDPCGLWASSYHVYHGAEEEPGRYVRAVAERRARAYQDVRAGSGGGLLFRVHELSLKSFILNNLTLEVPQEPLSELQIILILQLHIPIHLNNA